MAPKIKEWQQEVESSEMWERELSAPGLMVVELYSKWFGSCEVLAPTIDSIMKQSGGVCHKGAECDIRWRRVNVAAREEERKTTRLEQEKKSSQELAAGRSNGEAQSVDTSDLACLKDITCNPDALSKLEKWSGFCHPQPFFLFFKNGEVYDILRAANPPVLERMIAKYNQEEAEPNCDIQLDVCLAKPKSKKADKPSPAVEKLVKWMGGLEIENADEFSPQDALTVYAGANRKNAEDCNADSDEVQAYWGLSVQEAAVALAALELITVEYVESLIQDQQARPELKASQSEMDRAANGEAAPQTKSEKIAKLANAIQIANSEALTKDEVDALVKALRGREPEEGDSALEGKQLGAALASFEDLSDEHLDGLLQPEEEKAQEVDPDTPKT